MISTVSGGSMIVVSFRDLKAKAIVPTCGVTAEGKTRKFKDPNSANAFSVFKYFTVEGEDVLHSNFRRRLTESLKACISDLREPPPILPPSTRSSSAASALS
ncbi:hypothetical protein INT48_001170 [Thamnidium elegans]|uniref:Uncharacterized protein n=1 Tax=Thamnidium elegans TaxID=101142 RepID=A0A8H7SIW8_9FUNG|nr:hypothetical protein INT48_001170 [Thamnidium elegans]